MIASQGPARALRATERSDDRASAAAVMAPPCSAKPVSEGLERDVVVLLPGILELLVAQHGERAREPPARVARHDHVVDEAAASGDEGGGEFLAIFLGARLDLLGVPQLRA